MQTRLQKLDLLRKALVTATKQLFPDEGQFDVAIRFYFAPEEFRNEANREGFVVENSGDTEWLVNKNDYGEIVLYK